MDPASGKIGVVRQEALPEEAFFHLGAAVVGKVRVVVEDRLAKAIVEKSLRARGQAMFDLFDIVYFPGGCKTLWSFYIPIFAAENRDDIVVYLDGDQKPSEKNEFPIADAIGRADESKLGTIIKAATGVNIEFPVDGTDGSGNNIQRIQAQRQFINWAKSRVGFMPDMTPERFVWERAPEQAKLGIQGVDYKKNFAALTRKELGLADFEEVTGDNILHTQRRLLSLVDDGDAELVQLRESLHSFVQ